MSVYYKFKSAKDYDSIPIEGQFISLANLKERIFESKHLGRGTDFDLMISNAQNNEEYVDEATMIPKNTSVLIRRVPGCPRKPIVTQPDEPKIIENRAEELLPQSSMLVGDSSTAMKYPEESEWDEFGNDLYAIPDVVATQPNNPQVDITPASKIDEENKLKALIETPALDWSCQGQAGFGGRRGFGRGMGGRMMAGRGFGRGGFERSGFERMTPPVGYTCYRCKVPGHFIQHCPTNGDPNYDVRKMKPPTGIPKSMLMATPDGSYSLPSGAVAVLKPNEAAFDKEMEGMPSNRSVSELPPELRCPLCKEVMKDAVLTSKCCFKSFCDKCIRNYIIGKSTCVCGATNILADDLLPNKTLRETISRIMESTTSSTENVGSLAQVQDMESARHFPPEIPSPALSATSKDEPKQTPHMEHISDMKDDNAKEGDAASEVKVVDNVVHSSDKNTMKNTDQSEATPESMSAKEPLSAVNTRVPEESQEKLIGDEQVSADLQWRGFQDFGAENYAGMPLGPTAYNPYWGGGLPMGLDGFMPPFGGAMPYMGYVPSPFDVPFGGMMPPDPFAAQGYMMQAFPPRDLSELGCNNMSMNKGPPMSREDFEAMKSGIRRKREREQLNEREHLRVDRRNSKEAHHESSRRSPLPHPSRPPSKRRSSELELEGKAAAAAAGEEEESRIDRKLKGSVFSRISFPGSDKEMATTTTKKRNTTTSSSLDSNGVINHHHHHRRRDDMVSNGHRRSSYEHEPSDEGEEEDHHFKRRTSRVSRERSRETVEKKRR